MDPKASAKIKEFFGQFKSLHYRQGEAIIRADDDPQRIFYIKSGYVKMYAVSDKGMELTLHIMGPESYFPASWIVNIPNKSFYEALTSVEVFRVPKEKVSVFLQENPEVMFDLTERILTRSGELQERVECFAFGNAAEKISASIFYLAERFGIKENNYILIRQRFTHQDIATLAGVARETVSLEIEKMEKDNVLIYKKHLIMIKDLEKLKKCQ